MADRRLESVGVAGEPPASVRPANLPAGFFDSFELALADRLAAFDVRPCPEVWLALALACRGLATGRVCLRLREIAGRPLDEALLPARVLRPGSAAPGERFFLPGFDEWRAALEGSSVVAPAGTFCPLVLVGGERLYLHRPWAEENRLAARLRELAAGGARPPRGAMARLDLLSVIDEDPGVESPRPVPALREPAASGGSAATAGRLGERSPPQNRERPDPEESRTPVFVEACPDAQVGALLDEFCVELEGGRYAIGGARAISLNAEQRQAILRAATAPLTVIAGGAGTGKTTIVASLLVLLARAAGEGALPQVRIAAPTGKAANRLAEQLAVWCEPLDPEGHVEAMLGGGGPATIHRLLGARRDGSRFRHHAGDPLPADLVIVDETSMVDLALMARLVDALKPGARLVLLGDGEQLPPVEVGNVFRELCGDEPGGNSASSVKEPHVAPLPQVVVRLGRSMRFGEDSGIARLATLIRGGRVDEVAGFPLDGFADIEWHETLEPTAAATRFADSYGPLLEAARSGTSGTALDALRGFRVLCVHREGEHGVEGHNQQIEARLRTTGRIAGEQRWFPGRPVLVTHNDYALQLFNGDTGVAVAGREGRALRVHVEGNAGPRLFAGTEADRADAATREHAGGRDFEPGRLAQVETCWAMTVHKSQGSEFETVAFVLPPAESRLLVRELVYTAVTRARRRLVIHGSRERLAGAVARSLPRASGLAEQLVA